MQLYIGESKHSRAFMIGFSALKGIFGGPILGSFFEKNAIFSAKTCCLGES